MTVLPLSTIRSSSSVCSRTRLVTARVEASMAGVAGREAEAVRELLTNMNLEKMREEMAKMGIDVRVDSAGVGQNLQDHLIVGVRYRTRAGATLFSAESAASRPISSAAP